MANLDKLKNKILNKLKPYAIVAGLAVTPTLANAQTNQNAENNETKVNKIELSQATQSNIDVQCFAREIELDAKSPLEMLSKVDNKGAFYDAYLNNGAGGICVTQYKMSDENAYLKASTLNNSNLKLGDALNGFNNYVSRIYGDKIQSLADAENCMNKFSANKDNSKKDKLLYDKIFEQYNKYNLAQANKYLDIVKKTNSSNLQNIEHEKTHAVNGNLMKDINSGKIMLTAGDILKIRMADELCAQINGGQIQGSAQNVDSFFQEKGNEYLKHYSQDLEFGNDASYNRQFAYSLDFEKGAEKTTLNAGVFNCEINNNGMDGIGRFETDKGFVFAKLNNNISDENCNEFSHNGKKYATNCLVDEKGSPIKDDKGNKIPATISRNNEGDFVATLASDGLATTTMQNNYEKCLSTILSNYTPEQQETLKSALNKYCNKDASELNNSYLVSNKESLLKLKNETTKEDMNYITSLREKNNQKVSDATYSDSANGVIKPLNNGNNKNSTIKANAFLYSNNGRS